MVNTKPTHPSSTSTAARVDSNGNAITRMHSSMKRPRAPIACIRCHHKKVRCDGEHPNCARCTQGGVLCAYPSSRRSRNAQSTSVDPFIDNLSQLEVKIQQIEADLESQRSLFLSFQIMPATTSRLPYAPDTLEGPRRLTKDISLQRPKRSIDNIKKRSLPQQETGGSNHKKLKQAHPSNQKKMAPKVKTPSTSSLSSSPSSFASTEPASANSNNTLQHPQSYLFPALDPFSYNTTGDWSFSDPSYGPHKDGSYQPGFHQPQTSSFVTPTPTTTNFTPQQPSPLSTPEYTEEDQLLPSSSSSATSYRTPYPYTPATTLSHAPSCQIMDLYNTFSMDDLISFDSQNPAPSIMDTNAVWYC